MAISKPYLNVMDSVLAATTEATSAAFDVHPGARSATILLNSTQAGTLDVDMQLSTGAWVEISSATAVLANDATVVVLEFLVRAIRARFTPSAAPATVVIDASYSGVSQPI